LAASSVPAAFLAPVVIVAIYKVPVARTAVGVNVRGGAGVGDGTGTGVAPGPVKVNVAEVIVATSIASLNVAEIAVLTATP